VRLSINVEESILTSVLMELISIPTELNPIADFLSNFIEFKVNLQEFRTNVERYLASKKISARSSMELARIKVLLLKLTYLRSNITDFDVEECVNKNKDLEELTFKTLMLSILTDDWVSAKLRIPVMLLLSAKIMFSMIISLAYEVDSRFKELQLLMED